MLKIPEFSAIYGIRHLASGKVYVGSATRLKARLGIHKNSLKKGVHHSRYLQAAWDKYGPDAFEFIVLEYVSEKTRLLERENVWITALKSASPEHGFNMCPTAGSQLGMRHSPATREKMSAAHAGKKKTPEHQQAINAALAGRKLSDEHREKIAANQTGRKATDGTRQKMREANTNRKDKLSPDAYKRMVTANVGREFSPEHREKIAAANHRRTLSPETKAKISASRKKNAQAKPEVMHQRPLMGYELRSKLAGL